jgi:predicted MFS family arabinose efflux permease
MTVPLRRNRDFMLLWSGLVISVAGSRISQVGYPLLVLALTHSPTDAGVVGFLGTIPYLVFQLPAGVLVDRLNRRHLMLASDVIRGLALASVVVTSLTGALTLAQLMAVAFVEGTMFVVFNLGERAAVRFVVPAEQLPAALAQNEARNRAAMLAGRPIGGLLFGVGRALPFLADALSYVASLVTLLLIRSDFGDERDAQANVRSAWPEIREGLAWLARHPFMRAASLLVAGLNFVSAGLMLILIVAAKDHGASSAAVGGILAGSGVGGLVGSLLSPAIQRRTPAKVVVTATAWVWLALLVPIAFVTSPYALGTLYAGIAFMSPPWNVVINAYQLVLIPDRLLGRVASAGFMAAYGAQPLGSLAAGLLLSAVGAKGATLGIAGVTLALALAGSASAAIRGAPTLEGAPGRIPGVAAGRSSSRVKRSSPRRPPQIRASAPVRPCPAGTADRPPSARRRRRRPG